MSVLFTNKKSHTQYCEAISATAELLFKTQCVLHYASQCSDILSYQVKNERVDMCR